MSDNRKSEFNKRSHDLEKELKPDNERDSRDRSPPPKRSRGKFIIFIDLILYCFRF